MSGGFAFVPRKVAKASKAKVPLQNEASTSQKPQATVDSKGKGREVLPDSLDTTPPKSQYSDEDYTILLCLSLSKYRLWSHPDLRRDIELEANDGFFPFSYILEPTSPLSTAHSSETVIVKALRAHATQVVEVRMAIPSDGPRRARGHFEIRPKLWEDGAEYPVTREGWESRTVYVESIPVKCKTIPALCRFILALLPASSSMVPHNRIQAVTLPPHHTDDPKDEPKLKSFALITFADSADVETLLTAWPWDRQRQNHTEDSPDASEAVKFGFRVLSKARWEELNAEYLRYRTQLLADINGAEEPVASPEEPAPPVDEQPALTVDSPFPPNCLVFVRHVHPESNKTTLRKFLAQAAKAKDAIDYVDFNKGMDTCYIRLTDGAHARDLVDYFTSNRMVQTSGLDETGCPDGSLPVEAELVVGKREEVYWEKVPEKVRGQAVRKAL
ncbi:hypothetical protein FB45DRAFT_695804, partial [Roridomyces roridus]